MEYKFSESPVKNSLVKKLSPNHSLVSQKTCHTKGVQQSSKSTMNKYHAHLSQLSAKIEGVEKRIKDQDGKVPLLRQSNKVTKGVDLLGKYKNKSSFISSEEIRSSWDNTVQLDFLKDAKDNNNEEDKRMSFDINTDLSSKNKLNQLMKNKFSGTTTGSTSIPFRADCDIPKQNLFSLSQVTLKVPDNTENVKEKDKNENDDKIKHRIQKSMEMLQLIKNNELNKTKKEKGKKPEEKRSSEIVNGFQIGRMLGKGKFGKVFLSMHIETGFMLAIKQVSKAKLVEYNIVEQFIKEIKLHNALDHPKIVKFFGFFQEKDNFYLLLEYMNGGTLFDYLNVVKTLKIKETVQFLKDVIDAVTEMHDRSIAHRDIKPENIVINTEGVAKLCDFGWAALVDKARTTYCGTLQYVSPEILERKGYDESVDIWSLGILTYEMLMGRAPFQNYDRSLMKQKIMNMNLSQLLYSDNVPPEAQNFIEWLVQKDPLKRPKIRDLTSHEMFRKYSVTKNLKKTLQ